MPNKNRNKNFRKRRIQEQGFKPSTNTISDPNCNNMFLHIRIGTDTEGPYRTPVAIEGKNKYNNHNGFNVYFFLVHTRDRRNKQFMFNSDIVILKDHTQEDNYLLYYISQDKPDLSQFDHLLKKEMLPDGKVIEGYSKEDAVIVQEFIEDNKILYQGPFLAVSLLIDCFKWTKDEKNRTVFLKKEYLTNEFSQDLQYINEIVAEDNCRKENNNDIQDTTTTS